MNKVQYENLTRFVNEEFPEKLSDGTYFNGDCFCAIGALMNKVKPSFNFEELSTLDNRDTINHILNGDNIENTELVDVAKLVIDEFGLTEEDLDKIQEENDSFIGYRKDRSDHVKEVIKEIIDLKKEEGLA